MKKESQIDLKVVFIIAIIIFSLSILVVVAKTLANTENKKDIQNTEQIYILNDTETKEVFSKYHKI